MKRFILSIKYLQFRIILQKMWAYPSSSYSMVGKDKTKYYYCFNYCLSKETSLYSFSRCNLCSDYFINSSFNFTISWSSSYFMMDLMKLIISASLNVGFPFLLVRIFFGAPVRSNRENKGGRSVYLKPKCLNFCLFIWVSIQNIVILEWNSLLFKRAFNIDK